ncbi:tetratricopeptide repeat protein [Streptomyces tropicalis]|uniref:Tetratricopeptide repeat protein n=1 Tax=Streptomyces tropicalis TaxID=3034234 RepID=A0ABT6A1T6_9ACTN|nr:tetratricopeptide repeat protein [Streptomyces tropicalis]MDF3298417.1 tetratricopeptide repeat protein [Streptomyces tropicalis]
MPEAPPAQVPPAGAGGVESRGTAVYEMHRPVRRVPVRALPGDAPFELSLAVHSQLTLIASPGLADHSAEAVRIPLTGHNLLLSVSPTGPDEVVVRSLHAEVTDRRPLSADGVSSARPRMPDMVMSADLLESVQRAVQAYRRLRSPGIALDLDGHPVAAVSLGGAAVLPLTVAPGASGLLVCAPVTDDRRWVHWRLHAEIECAGRILRPHWDLTVTAASGLSRFSAGAAPEPAPVHHVHPDHWDPRNPDRHPAEVPSEGQRFEVVAHLTEDGRAIMTVPSVPAPEPEPPGAADLVRRGDALARSGDPARAAAAYRKAADAGSGPAAYALGRLLQDLGDRPGAVAWYERAAARRVSPAYNNLGVMALLRGDLDEAECRFRQGMDVGDWVAAVGLGAVLERRGDEAGAESVWRLAGGQKAPNATQNLGVLLQRQGRQEEADELFARAADEGDAQAAVRVGVSRMQQGELDDAERWLRRAAEAGDAFGAFCLGLLLLRSGRDGEGEGWWERAALRLDALRQEAGAVRDAETSGTTFMTGAPAESGEAQSAFRLGARCFGRRDFAAAERWWTLGARAGHPDAALGLVELALNVRGDVAACLEWASHAVGLDALPAARLEELASAMFTLAAKLVEAPAPHGGPLAAARACSVAAAAYGRLTAHDAAHRPAWESTVHLLAHLAGRSGSAEGRRMAAVAEARLRGAPGTAAGTPETDR